MRKSLLMAIAGFMLILGCGAAIHAYDLSIFGFRIGVVREFIGGMAVFNGSSAYWYEELTYSDTLLTTNERGTISFPLTNESDKVIEHVYILSGGSPGLKVEPSAEQTITLNPHETKIVSWTLSTPYPSIETVSITASNVKVLLYFQFVPSFLGLTATQMMWVLHAGVLLGMILFTPLLAGMWGDEPDD